MSKANERIKIKGIYFNAVSNLLGPLQVGNCVRGGVMCQCLRFEFNFVQRGIKQFLIGLKEKVILEFFYFI